MRKWQSLLFVLPMFPYRFLPLFAYLVLSTSVNLRAQDPQSPAADPPAQTATSTDSAAAQKTNETDSAVLADHDLFPTNRLTLMQDKLADIKDEPAVRRMMYSNSLQHLTIDQVTEAKEAAQRRVNRQRSLVESRQKLVDAGIVARMEVQPLKDELAMREQTLALITRQAQLAADLLASVKAEEARLDRHTLNGLPVMLTFSGRANFDLANLSKIERAYQNRWRTALPISARGQTATHQALGFDHRDKADIALSPDSKEGIWLRKYLEKSSIPYLAFRAAVAGSATAAHIHLGTPSKRQAPLLVAPARPAAVARY